MPRKVFHSFHYKPDNWRAAQVRNIGSIEGNTPVSSNTWEEVTNAGDEAIKTWITNNMASRTCLVALIGENTANRKWINYEIEKAWRDKRGVVGVHIHGLQNSLKEQANKGQNPFDFIYVDGKKLSTIVKAYDTPYTTSTYVYDHIKNNMEEWVEEAIKIRNDYK